MDKKSVLIFRKNILPYSETFIADQGKFLVNYIANYCGLTQDDTGANLLSGSTSIVLEKYVKNIRLAKFAYRLGIPASQWMDDIQSLPLSIIHAHFLNDGIDALFLQKKLMLPLITTLHGHDITKKERSTMFRAGRDVFFKRVDKVIAVSDYIYEKALNNGCPESKLVKHSIGIDLGKFSQDKIESAEPEIVFVGRLVEKKGCIYLLEAMALLKTKYPELKLTVVGDGMLKSELQKKTRYEQLNVDFVGKESAEKIRDRLAKAWVFVAPSITAENGDAEGLGMVFLEAQALRTPVVSFRSGGVVEAVEDGVTGLLSNEKDVNGLAESIAYFIDNNSVRLEFGDRGRVRVEENFDIRKQCQLLETIYDNVC